MDIDVQSSFNTSTSFFEKLLYKDLLADLPASNTQDNEDTSTVAPESRSTSCKSEIGKNFNPFALFAPKFDLEMAKTDLKVKSNVFVVSENSKTLINNTVNILPQKKSIKLKGKINVMLNQSKDVNFNERFKEIEKFTH